MKRKLGPLQLWQWALLGAIVGAGTLLYRRGHPAAQAAQNMAAAATPSDAQFNPIDPTTGLPVSGGLSTGAGISDVPTPADSAGSSGGGLNDLLSNFSQLIGVLGDLQALTPPPGDAQTTDQGAVQTQVGSRRAKPKKASRKAPKTKKHTAGGTANPGHHVTSHGHGRKTAGSSAPHNPRQHHNVAAPAHQRHEPTRHPSAQHPAAHQPSPTHSTPAAHPPARRGPRRRRR